MPNTTTKKTAPRKCSLCKKTDHNRATCSRIAEAAVEVAPVKQESLVPLVAPVTPATQEAINTTCDIANRVRTALGVGQDKKHYHAALNIGLRNSSLKYEMERILTTTFEDQTAAVMCVDFIVAKKLIVEHVVCDGTGEAQISKAEGHCDNYMRETNIRNALVIVFPSTRGGDVVFRHVCM
jgi:GxxExxY protein